MLRRTFGAAASVVTWPVKRSGRLVRDIGRNGATLTRALRRGITTNPKRNAPVSPGMTSDEVAELDRWWATLTEEQRTYVWAEHDRELLDSAREAERQGSGIWSLTNDVKMRERGLRKGALPYFAWMTAFFGTSAAFLVVTALGRASFMFILMSVFFLAFIAPEVLGKRITRAQLLYGRRITSIEFFKPLPREMQRQQEGL